MKIVKQILIGLGILLALLLLVAAFLPKSLSLSETIVIRKPQKEVMDYLKVLKNQDAFSEWVKADPNLHPEITGTDGTVGAKQSWNSKIDDVGEGNQTITALTESRMDVDIEFIRPMKGKAKAGNILKPISEKETELTVTFFMEANWPFNLMANTMGRYFVGKTEKQNLLNIKQILEK